MNKRTGRNEPCPCGSGKKYKRCCQVMEPPKPLPTQAKPTTPVPPARAGAAPSPGPPPRPRDEWDDWHDRYDDSSFAGKLDMLRALLAENRPPESYKDMDFIGAVLEAPRKLGLEDHRVYIAFLEEMFASRPDVFNLGADWFVLEIAYAYVRGGRDGDIARLLPPLLDDEYEPHEAVFDLVDLLRLAGLDKASRRLTFAMLERTRGGGYMAWAVEGLIEFSVFFLFRDAVEAGCAPAALDEVRRQLALIDCKPTEEALMAMLAHRAGTVNERLELKDLLGQDEPAGFNLYLLSLDFGRWLTKERKMPPLVADTMRCFVHWCLGEMRKKSDRNPLVLHEQRLEEYLARLLGFMSLLRLRAVATLIGMHHFHDFLLSAHLIEEGGHRRAKRICDDLGSKMRRALGDTAADYAFLDQYVCAAT